MSRGAGIGAGARPGVAQMVSRPLVQRHAGPRAAQRRRKLRNNTGVEPRGWSPEGGAQRVATRCLRGAERGKPGAWMPEPGDRDAPRAIHEQGLVGDGIP
jgi:hypothetical protein